MLVGVKSHNVKRGSRPGLSHHFPMRAALLNKWPIRSCRHLTDTGSFSFWLWCFSLDSQEQQGEEVETDSVCSQKMSIFSLVPAGCLPWVSETHDIPFPILLTHTFYRQTDTYTHSHTIWGFLLDNRPHNLLTSLFSHCPIPLVSLTFATREEGVTTHISLVHKAHIQVSLSKKLSMNLLAFAYSKAVQISVPSTPVRLFHGLAEQALDLA